MSGGKHYWRRAAADLLAGPPSPRTAADLIGAELQVIRDQPLTRGDLDMARCPGLGCGSEHGPLIIHVSCHRQAPVWLVYTDGELIIVCSECELEAFRIQVG